MSLPNIEFLFERLGTNAKKCSSFFGLCLKTEDQSTNAVIDQYRDFSRRKIMEFTFWPDKHASSAHDLMDQLAAIVDKNWATSKQNVLKEDSQIGPWLSDMDQKYIKWAEKFSWRSLRTDLSELWKNCLQDLARWKKVVEMETLLEDSGKEHEKYDKDWNRARRRVEEFLGM